MDWLERLNRLPGRLPLPEGGDGFFPTITTGSIAAAPSRSGLVVDIRHWAYSPHLPDNVPHRHTYFEVCLVGDHGRGWYIVEGRRHPIGPGALFFARPGVLHQIINDPGEPPMELLWVAFHAALPGDESSSSVGALANLFRRFAESATVLVTPDEGRSIRASWEALRATAGHDAIAAGPGFAARVTALIGALIVGIAEMGGGLPDLPATTESYPSDDDALGQRAVRYIHERLGRPLTVPEIAEQVGISPRHLTRLFARFAGIAPAAYIEAARMQRARTLLLRTDDPIKQIGAQVGYEDVHHFTRVFTRAVGCPPGLFRKTRGAAARPILQGENIREPGTFV